MNTSLFSILLLILIVFALPTNAKQDKLVVSSDTTMYDSVPVGENEFDTVIVESGATLRLTHADSADGFKGAYNLQALQLFYADSGASVTGVPGMEGFLAINDGKVVNHAGTDSIHNISLNLYGNATLQGDPFSIMNIIAGWGGRHIFLDTTVTLRGSIFSGYDNSIFIGQNDTLVLGDTARINMTGGEPYPHVLFDTNSVVKRKVSAQDIGVKDTLPFGFTSNAEEAVWATLKLDTGVTFGPDPYITYELIQKPHPAIDTASGSYLDIYLKIRGHDIHNLKYDVSLHFASQHVKGDASTLVNTFYTDQWQCNGAVKQEQVRFKDLTEWGELTALSGPEVQHKKPGEGATAVALDSVIAVKFAADIDSVDFSRVHIQDEAANEVPGIAITLDTLANELRLDHDDFPEKDMTYSVTIPAGTVKDTANIINHDINWSFTTIMPPPEVTGVSPIPGDTIQDLKKELSVMYSQEITMLDSTGVIINSKNEDSVPIDSINIENANNTLHIHHDKLPYGDSIALVMAPHTVTNTDGVSNATDTLWNFTTREALSAPVPVSFVPSKGDSAVVPDTTVSITFDKDIWEGDFSKISISSEKADSVSITKVTRENNQRTITMGHSVFNYQDTITVSILPGAVINKDSIENTAINWSFTTALSSSIPKVENSNISITPNPVNDVLVINSTEVIEKVQMYDIQGRKRFSRRYESRSAEIEVSDRAAGIYILMVQTRGSKVQQKIFIE